MDIVPYSFFGFDSVWPEDGIADIVVLPVAYGIIFGPLRLLQASRRLDPYHHEFAIDLEQFTWLTLDEFQSQHNAEVVVREIRGHVSHLMEQYAKHGYDRRPFLLVVGGEQTITVGVVAGLLETYPDLVIGQFDAHSDFLDTDHATKYSDSTVGRRLDELVGGRLRQFGVRARDRHDPERARQCSDSTPDRFLENLKRLAPAERVHRRLSPVARRTDRRDGARDRDDHRGVRPPTGPGPTSAATSVRSAPA